MIGGFKVGDRVKLVDSALFLNKGEKGVVCYQKDGSIGVNWDTKDSRLHDCNGNCEDNHGWYVKPEKIVKVRKVTAKLKEERGFTYTSGGKQVSYKAGMKVTTFIKKLLAIETDKEKIKWLRTFDNCVLPKEVRDMINEALTVILNANKFEEWGVNEHFEKGITNSILIYGVPGTGKTMVSESIATVLGKNLIKIGSGELQSPVPGQTERNIKEAFETAKERDAVLLFDECDSILSNRDAVGTILAAEINALLTEIENCDGVVILTTNRLHKLDPALQRRIIAKVELPVPTKEAREEIWEKLIPKKTPINDINYKELSEFTLTGGEIKNAILLGIRKAIASNKKEVTHANFLSAVEMVLKSKQDFEDKRDKNVYSKKKDDMLKSFSKQNDAIKGEYKRYMRGTDYGRD